jgi:hypothetical protein
VTDRPERDDPAIRKELLEISLATDRAAFEVNQNPLFVLFAIARHRDDEELPLWVRQWWSKFAKKVLHIARQRLEPGLSSAEAVEEAYRALGLTRRGWNAFDELQRNRDDDLLAILRSQGWSVEDIAAMLPSPNPDEQVGINPAGVYRRTNRAYKRWPRIGPRRRPRAKK